MIFNFYIPIVFFSILTMQSSTQSHDLHHVIGGEALPNDYAPADVYLHNLNMSIRVSLTGYLNISVSK